MSEASGFRARPRAPRTDHDLDAARLLAELARLRSRFDRAVRDGRDEFTAADSDGYDIGMLAVIHLADFVARELPEELQAKLPPVARDGLRATRNIAAHNYAELDNSRLWATLTVQVPALLDLIEGELRG